MGLVTVTAGGGGAGGGPLPRWQPISPATPATKAATEAARRMTFDMWVRLARGMGAAPSALTASTVPCRRPYRIHYNHSQTVRLPRHSQDTYHAPLSTPSVDPVVES